MILHKEMHSSNTIMGPDMESRKTGNSELKFCS